MKAIMISDKPRWCALMMNGDKNIEVRKSKALATAIQKLIDENGYADIYVHCSKSNTQYLVGSKNKVCEIITKGVDTRFSPNIDKYTGNGKVLFKFRCYKVEEFRPFFHWCIEKETCLTHDEVLDYLDSKDKSVGNPKRQGKVYCIHISDLEIFDRPKELSEFYHYVKYNKELATLNREEWDFVKLTKAPQSFCYVEVE